MEKQAIFGLLLVITTGAMSQQGFEVRLKLKNMDSAKVLLSYSIGEKFTMDTNAILENGIYIFKGKVEEPLMAHVVIRKKSLNIPAGRGIIPSPSLGIILSNDKIEIDGDADEIYTATVSGGKSNKEWNKIKPAEAQFIKEGWEAVKNGYKEFSASKDSAALDAGFKVRSEAGKKADALKEKFMLEQPNSLVSVYFLSEQVYEMSVEDMEKRFNKLGADYKNSKPARQIAGMIKELKATAIGKAAIELNKKDMQGNPVTLATLKGKYVLLDFWGSWCGPCRKSHPHLKEVYKKYKSKGLEIVGISSEGGAIEDARRKWKKAVEEDGIDWIQVLNDEGKDQFDAVKSYGISAFPTKLLLDKDGVILARYIGDSEDLDKKLEELLGK